MANFDADTLRELRDVRELRIRTGKHPTTAVVIWIVVADDQVFVRSWLCARGRWYRDLAAGGPPQWSSAGAVLRCRRSRRATTPRSLGRRRLPTENQPSPHAREMVRSEVLLTTLRLEPR